MSAPPGYCFLRHINDGGFGTVIEVEENSTGLHFAVKMMPCISEKDNERIGREVKRLRTFVHPHIVGLKEVVKMENMQAIVMELGEQSLAQVVKSHSERGVLIDRHIVYQVMVDISSALCFMHNHQKERTAHGDVKLENILLFGDGHAKLCDLGAAESEDVSSTRGVMSMQYVSPERLDDAEGRACESGDVWALGIVLHFLLFGKSPFRSAHAAGLIREIGSFRASQIGTSCGEDECELLKRLLDPNCGSRLTSKQLKESSILRCLINTTWGGWKLREMQSREMESKVAELQSQLKMEQNRGLRLQTELTRVQNEKEEAEKERNDLRRKMDEIEAMMVGPRAERGEERVVQSRNGADAIEWFKTDHWNLSGSVFTHALDFPSHLLSSSFGRVVARFTFTFGRATMRHYFGIMNSSLTDEVKSGSQWFANLLGGAGWNVSQSIRRASQNRKGYSRKSACAAGKEGQRVVLETDGRDGKRTLRLCQDGETQPTFFSNIPVPFRFAILFDRYEDAVSIESVEELTEPTLTGGTIEIRMDRR